VAVAGEKRSRSASQSARTRPLGSASEAWRVSGQVAGVCVEMAALARDLPRFRVLSTGAWNRARADVAPQDCSALAAWPGVGEQVEQRMG
jgi:hypothetical protein